MTTRQTIPGRLTAASYAMLAQQHRPDDLEALQREIRRLHTELHLSPRDISLALRVALSDVLDAIKSNSPTTEVSND